MFCLCLNWSLSLSFLAVPCCDKQDAEEPCTVFSPMILYVLLIPGTLVIMPHASQEPLLLMVISNPSPYKLQTALQYHRESADCHWEDS